MRLWIDFLLQIAMFLLSSELTVPWFQLILSYRKKKKFFLTYPSPVSVYQLLPMKDMLLFGQFTITITIVLVAQLCPTLCNPMDCSLARLLCPWNSPGKNTGVGSHFLFQGIFLTQGSNLGQTWVSLHCRQILYHLSYQESPNQPH